MTHYLSRRQFIASCAAAAMCSRPQLLPAAQASAPQRDFGRWPFGIQTYSLRKFNAVEAIRHVQMLGVHYVEFANGDIYKHSEVRKR